MIPGTSPSRQSDPLTSTMGGIITDLTELLQMLDLESKLPLVVNRQFPLRVPRSYAARMRKNDPQDPLLRQVLPISLERVSVPGFDNDPVGDKDALVVPELLHKYYGRALLITTQACAIHCRFCFRQQFPYPIRSPNHNRWDDALQYLAQDSTITELILSGGDPLCLSNRQLQELFNKLTTIPHLQRLRIHSRLPIVMPERLDQALMELIGCCSLKIILVLHTNHPQEVDSHVSENLLELKAMGITLLNQAVLLNGINDSADVLAELSHILFKSGILPYYLHLLDRVQGSAHFEVELTRATNIMQQLSRRLPGYLVPRLVQEQPGQPAKILVS